MVVSTLKRDCDEKEELMRVLACLSGAGADIRTERLHPSDQNRFMSLASPVPEKRYEMKQKQRTGKNAVHEKSELKLKLKIQNYLVSQISAISGTDLSETDFSANFMDMGLDSPAFISLADDLESVFNIRFYPTLFFNYQNTAALADYLEKTWPREMSAYFKAALGNRDMLIPNHTEKTGKISAPNYEPDYEPDYESDYEPDYESDNESGYAPDNEKISYTAVSADAVTHVAIIGMSGIFPGAPDTETFWKNLENQKDSVTEIPGDRAELKQYLDRHGAGNVRAGFVRDIDKFDPLFFRISPREANLTDPQQRIFLETVWKAVEDAGYQASELSGTRTGIFVGVASNDYAGLMVAAGLPPEAYTSVGTAQSVLANRVSYIFDFRAPA